MLEFYHSIVIGMVHTLEAHAVPAPGGLLDDPAVILLWHWSTVTQLVENITVQVDQKPNPGEFTKMETSAPANGAHHRKRGLGGVRFYANTEGFPFVSTECPLGKGMWGISLGVGTECTNSVGFQWLSSLLPDLCPLCVP